MGYGKVNGKWITSIKECLNSSAVDTIDLRKKLIHRRSTCDKKCIDSKYLKNKGEYFYNNGT